MDHPRSRTIAGVVTGFALAATAAVAPTASGAGASQLSAAAGAAALGATNSGRLVATRYGYEGTSYGTRVLSDSTGVSSGRSAFSYVTCTKFAGKNRNNSLVSISVPADSPFLEVDSVKSNTKTIIDKKNNIAGAMVSTNDIARVAMGGEGTPKLTLTGLKTRSMAWATKSGKLKSKNMLSSTDISLVDLPEDVPSELQGPLDDLLGALGGGINEVIGALNDNGGKIEIPGLGRVSVGYDKSRTKAKYSSAGAYALRVLLYGPDGVKDPQNAEVKDDTLVGIGRTFARINKYLPAGVMIGRGWGLEAEVAAGVGASGRIGEQPLPCMGSEGEIQKASVVGADIPSAGGLDLGVVGGESYGVARKNGSADAWTRGTVASVEFGPLKMLGISGKARVKKSKGGKLTRSIKGSVIGEILVDGESQGAFDKSGAGEIPPLEIDGLGGFKFFKRTNTGSGVKVSAVQFTVAPGTELATVIKLGNAQTFIKRN